MHAIRDVVATRADPEAPSSDPDAAAPPTPSDEEGAQ